MVDQCPECLGTANFISVAMLCNFGSLQDKVFLLVAGKLFECSADCSYETVNRVLNAFIRLKEHFSQGLDRTKARLTGFLKSMFMFVSQLL